jgi:hypothetical protein
MSFLSRVSKPVYGRPHHAMKSDFFRFLKLKIIQTKKFHRIFKCHEKFSVWMTPVLSFFPFLATALP